MQNSVQQFFDAYATALLSYDAEKIAGFYQVPMAVYSDEGVQTVTAAKQVTGFWQEGVKPYKAAGITSAKPEILSEEQVSKNIIIAKVQWKNTKADGTSAGEETNVYILSNGKEGFKISGLVIIDK